MPNRRTRRMQLIKLRQKNKKANHGRKPNLSSRRLKKLNKKIR